MHMHRSDVEWNVSRLVEASRDLRTYPTLNKGNRLRRSGLVLYTSSNGVVSELFIFSGR